MKKYVVVISALTFLLVTVGAYAMSKPKISSSSDAWRYKMIVTVETPEGIVTGSAVRQMGNDSNSSFIPEVGNPADVRGEAVVVDMGKRGVLFALISHQSDLEFYNAFPVPGYPPNNGGSTPEGIKYYASLPVGTKGTLNPEQPPGYPKLVKFKDINDPKSVVEAHIWERKDDGMFFLREDRMAELFGKGVKLRDITLEITREPMTKMIAQILPWLSDYYDQLLDGNTIHTTKSAYPLANRLGSGSFSTDRNK